MESNESPITNRLCESWFTVQATAPPLIPRPLTNPFPMARLHRCRSITAMLATSAAALGWTTPSTTLRSAVCIVFGPPKATTRTVAVPEPDRAPSVRTARSAALTGAANRTVSRAHGG